MSKVICDICGTSYPETAKQCPICGCVRPGDVQRVTNEIKNNGNVSTGYTYVKGGRFSKSNVKKRSQTKDTAAAAPKSVPQKDKNNGEDKSNRGLVITAAILLLAIIGVVIYIAIRFFAPISVPKDTGSSTSNTQQNVLDLACKEITLDTENVVFGEIGEARLLYVTVSPENTTDRITFHSEDETVATVSDAGKITAVAEGTTKVIVTCGEITKECTVTCQINDPSSSETTVPDETTEPEETTKPEEIIRLNRKDITFDSKGSSWVLYSGSVAKNLITWSSDDETVAIFTDGKVVAVGPGMTNVHAEFEGQKVSCIIRCDFQASSGVGGNGGVSEDGGSSGNGGVSEDGGSATTTKTGTITNVSSNVNIRKGPGISYEKVGTIDLGERVTITETKDADGMTWAKIGTDKWVSMDYIKLD